MIKRATRPWATRHLIALSSSILALIVCATFLLLATLSAERNIREARNKTTELSAKYDKLIPELKAKRLAREAAEKAAAAEAAEAAKTVTPGMPVSTDNTCTNLPRGHGDPSKIDILVNKAHCLSPRDFAPSDLVSVNGYLVSAKAARDLQAMLSAASQAGLTINLTSAYRSYQNQISTYNGWVTANGSTEAADTVSARPGYSEHQTGLAVDLGTSSCALECFAGTPHYAWLQKHAAEFGFIQRYYAGFEGITGYSPEAWHYRYVGSETALDMKAKGIKTLEQYWNISGGDYPG